MNKYIFLLSLFIGGGLFSCTQTNSNVELLERVEMYVDICPDSAMHILRKLEHPEKLYGKERADYALLLTQTLDKNYLDSLQSDSLIRLAVDYYKNGSEKVKAAKAYYYYGKIMVSKGKVSEAMKSYLDALGYLKETTDYKLQGLIVEHIGYLNSGQGVYENAVDNYRKSIECYELAGDSIGVVFGYRNIARGYYAKQNSDSARWYANKGLLMLTDTASRVKASLYQLLGLIAKDEKQFAQAINYFTSAIRSSKNRRNACRYYLSLGSLYMDAGEYGLAEECFNYCKNVNDLFISSGAHNYLYLLKKEARDFEQALLYKEKSDSILEIVRNDDLRSQLLTLQKKYETDKLIMENVQIKLEKENQAYLYLFLLLLIVGMSIYLIKKYKKNNLRNVEALKRNEKILEDYACKIAELELMKSQELAIRKESIGKLNRKILDLTIENKKIRENSNIEALYVLKELKEGRMIIERMTSSERQRIFDYLNLVYADFITRIKSEYELTKGELLLAALIKLGFSNMQLMIVFDCEMKSVYKSKQRLKSHLKLKKEDSLEKMIVFY